MAIRSTLGSRIKQVLSEREMSQAELARLVGVKQQTISYICSHEGGAGTSRYAMKIADVLGVNPLWLQSGKGGKDMNSRYRGCPCWTQRMCRDGSREIAS
jgi:transcriptional regulator with XRE-family HTH domain